MLVDKQAQVIDNYIAACNAFDVDSMLERFAASAAYVHIPNWRTT